MNTFHDAPLVSVVIPVHNGAEYIAESIQSVIDQDYPSVEIIVIDDGSTDDTVEAVKQFGDKVRLFSKSSGGIGSARNFGHKQALGKYIAWLDGDDKAQYRRLTLQVDVLENNPELSLVSSNFCAFSADGFSRSGYIYQYYSCFGGGSSPEQFYQQQNVVDDKGESFVWSGHIAKDLVYGNFIHPPTVMFPARLLDVAGELIESIRSSVDWEFLVRLATYGKCAYIDLDLIDYRLGPHQISSVKANPVAALNRLQVYEAISERLPQLVTSQPGRHARVLSDFRMDAINGLIPEERHQAWLLWRKNLGSRYALARQIRTFVKLITPGWVFTLKRSFSNKVMSG